VAGSPLKNIGMMAFMMWMSGSTVQIFSIMMTFTGIWQPLQAIKGSGQSEPPYTRQPFHTSSATLVCLLCL
jgi:hypothetical protein